MDDQLALLASRFNADEIPFDELVDCLSRNEGHVEKAYHQILISNRIKRPRLKLDHYFAKPELSATQKTKAKKRVKTVEGPNAFQLLKTPAEESIKSTDLPPLLLGTPALVEKHSPCTLHLDFLPPELASELYLNLLGESAEWDRNKWFMVERQVESPHTTAFYVAEGNNFDEASVFWYNGKQSPTKRMTAAMTRAKGLIEPFVNDLLRKRDCFPLEWDGPWQANVAAANCYAHAKESVGYHSDRLNYLGPYPTIASLSLGVTRTFRLRGSAQPGLPKRTFDIALPHNSLVIMHAGCQEGFKHAIIPARSIDLFRLSSQSTTYTQRCNLTYRFYRPDFCQAANSEYESLPVCKCGQPCILRPDMRNKQDGKDGLYRYYWMCQAGSSSDGKSCGHCEIMKMPGRRKQEMSR